MKRPNIQKTVGLTITIGWILLTAYNYIFSSFQTPGMIVLTALSIIFSIYTVVKKPDKKSSIFGKILIFGGVLGLVTLYINAETLANTDTAVRVLATVTGLYLEKISPGKALKKFMFLAIATKIQFIGTTAINNLITQTETVLTIHSLQWHLTVILMAISVPVLAKEKFNIYRLLVIINTLVALKLLTDTLTATNETGILIIAIGLTTWPLVISRVLGRRVFLKEQ